MAVHCCISNPCPLCTPMQGYAPAPWRNIDEMCANAPFLIKAVNNHDALVKALQWISDQHDCDPGTVKAADLCLVAKNALNRLVGGQQQP